MLQDEGHLLGLEGRTQIGIALIAQRASKPGRRTLAVAVESDVVGHLAHGLGEVLTGAMAKGSPGMGLKSAYGSQVDKPVGGVMASLLFIVAESQSRLPAKEVKGPLAGFFADALKPPHPEALVLCPASVPLDLPSQAQVIRYTGAVGLEANQLLWEPLRQTTLDQIIVVGLLPAIDHEEILLASHLKAASKVYLGRGDGAVHDICQWGTQFWPDLAPREVRARVLPAEETQAYSRRVHQWLGEQLTKAGLRFPPAGASGTMAP